LLDWTLPGAGPACWDLYWYLALNRARLPEPKEAAISRFRAALEDHRIATASWWQEQLDRRRTDPTQPRRPSRAVRIGHSYPRRRPMLCAGFLARALAWPHFVTQCQ
jgi:hypothetical protein